MPKTVKVTFSPDHNGEKSPYSKGQIKEKIADIMNRNNFEGYTLIKGIGYWRGIAERSYTVEVKGIEDIRDIESMREVSSELKDAFDQESTLFSIAEEAIDFI